MSHDKPWEEDWYQDFGEDDDDPLVRRSGDKVIQAAWIEDERRAKLLAAAPDLVRALLAVEWISRPDPFGDVCPWCGVEQAHDIPPPFRHATDCQRQAALRKAGVL